MVSINYPGMPQGPDIGGGLALGLQGLGELIDNKRANKAYEQYDAWLRGGQQGQQPQQPMSLASLGQQGGQVQRSPLPPVQDAASARVSQAHGDMGGDIFSRFMKTVQAGGVTNPAALAAIASTGKHESGFSDKNAYGTWDDPSQSGESGTSGGIMSWRGPRLQALQQFAQQNGDNPNAPKPETQAQFLLQEDPSLIQKLQQVRSPQEAQQLMNNAWRFAGYDQQGGEAGARMQTAQAFAGQFGGQGQGQDALQGFASPSGQQMPQGAPQASAGSLLPPADVMRQLFRSEQTRPLAIQLAQSAQKARMGDPMAQLELEKARLEVEKLRTEGTKPNIVNAGDGQLYDANTGQWIEGPGQQGGASGGFRFKGTSVEAQSLNGLIDSGQITPEQAQQLGAGKTITGPNGEIIFMTPQGVFGQPAGGGQPQPLGSQPAQGGNIPITEPKVTIDEKKAMTFADRMSTSGKIIDDMGTAGSGKVDQIASQVPGVGEYLTSNDFKKVDQAKRDFINAQLRRESGAVIADSEFDNANKQYFPQPNDTPEVLEQKRRNRQIVIDGMKRDSGPTYKSPSIGGATTGNRTSSGVEWSIDP